jgi:Fe-S cluster biogenesis protein NfuA
MENMNILQKVEASLDRIRPFLERDGGNVKVIEINDEGKLSLEFTGACGSCSMSNMTFKNGIEENVKKDVPEIKSVIDINLFEN